MSPNLYTIHSNYLSYLNIRNLFLDFSNRTRSIIENVNLISDDME